MSRSGDLALDGGSPALAAAGEVSWFAADHPDTDVWRKVRSSASGERQQHFVFDLERHWQEVTGRIHGVACRSGSVALRVAFASLDLKAGDEVICPADAIDLAAVLRRSDVVAVPVDLDLRTLHIDPAAVEAAITHRTQAIVAVDRYGTAANYRSLTSVARHHGLALVEDCSQSLGAFYDHRPVGAHGDLSICALTGDAASAALGTGGLLATDDDELALNARRIVLVSNEARPQKSTIDGDSLTGFTCRLSELSAAVGREQLRRNDDVLAARCDNGSHLRNRLSSIPGIWVPDVERGASHVYASFPVLVLPDELGLPEAAGTALRDTVNDCMAAEGVRLDRWPDQPGHHLGQWPTRQPGGAYPVAEALIADGLLLGRDGALFAPPNTTDQMDQIADCFAKVLVDNASRLRQIALERFHTHVMV